MLHNQFLEATIAEYKLSKKCLGEYDFNRMVYGKKFGVYSQVLQNVSRRVAKSFKGFFVRVKDPLCKKKGFPRFKSKVNSFSFPQATHTVAGKKYHAGFYLLDDRRLHIANIGNVKIVLHRELGGEIKDLTIKYAGGKWYAIFSCEIDMPIVEHSLANAVGIDLGLESFVTTSDGVVFNNPRIYMVDEKHISRLSRRMSKKRRASKNFRKLCCKMSVMKIRQVNKRLDWLHKLSNYFIRNYATICVEDLDINKLAKNKFITKHIYGASWGKFCQMLEYKAVTSGSKIIRVNPAMTSRICSNCGEVIKKMSLTKRTFDCPSCSFSCHRDLNASINILGRGTPESKPPEMLPLHSRVVKASGIDEVGTTPNT